MSGDSGGGLYRYVAFEHDGCSVSPLLSGFGFDYFYDYRALVVLANTLRRVIVHRATIMLP